MATRDLARRGRSEGKGMARYEPSPFYELRRRMDQTFEDVYGDFGRKIKIETIIASNGDMAHLTGKFLYPARSRLIR